MTRYAQRLSRVARTFGCRLHSEPLRCPTCQAPELPPGSPHTPAGDFLKGVLTRVGQEKLQEISQHVQPPYHGRCVRCGAPRECPTFLVRYRRDVLRAIALTTDEQATLEAILRACRRDRGSVECPRIMSTDLNGLSCKTPGA